MIVSLWRSVVKQKHVLCSSVSSSSIAVAQKLENSLLFFALFLRMATTQRKEGSMSGNASDQPRLTVGSLLGIPLGSTASMRGTAPSPAGSTPGPDQAPFNRSLATEERPWTIAAGALGPVRENYSFAFNRISEAINLST